MHAWLSLDTVCLRNTHICECVQAVCLCVCVGVWQGGELLMTHADTHSVDSCAPDVLRRVTSKSHLLSLWIVDIGTALIQHH